MISVRNYLEQAQALMDNGEYTDGCSLSQFMHKLLDRARLLCAAHDYGNLGKINGIRPGLVNQFYSLAAHLLNMNPVYWLWGTVVFTFTMPWIIWRREFGVKFIPPMLFFGLQFFAIFIYTIYITVN